MLEKLANIFFSLRLSSVYWRAEERGTMPCLPPLPLTFHRTTIKQVSAQRRAPKLPHFQKFLSAPMLQCVHSHSGYHRVSAKRAS